MAASTSTAEITPGTRNASWTNQVSSTSPRRDDSSIRTGAGGWAGSPSGSPSGGCGCSCCGRAVAGTQYTQPAGGGGQSGEGRHPAGGAHPAGGCGHPGGARHTQSCVLIGR